MSALDRLKMIQLQYKQVWNGINTEYTGRPGTSNLTNATRKFRPLPHLETEDERNILFQKVMDTLKNMEQEFPLLLPSGTDAKSRTTQNFYQKQKIDTQSNIGHYHY